MLWIKTTAFIVVVVGTVSKKLREVIRPGSVTLDGVCFGFGGFVFLHSRPVNRH